MPRDRTGGELVSGGGVRVTPGVGRALRRSVAEQVLRGWTVIFTTEHTEMQTGGLTAHPRPRAVTGEGSRHRPEAAVADAPSDSAKAPSSLSPLRAMALQRAGGSC